MRTPFAVGRLTPRSAEIVLLDGADRPAPFRGPFTLKALVEPIRRRLVRCQSDRRNTRVH